MPEHLGLLKIIEDVSISNEYEYENDLMPYSYSKSFSQLSMLAMTPSSSLWNLNYEIPHVIVRPVERHETFPGKCKFTLCRKYRVRLLFLDFKSSILHKT